MVVIIKTSQVIHYINQSGRNNCAHSRSKRAQGHVGVIWVLWCGGHGYAEPDAV